MFPFSSAGLKSLHTHHNYTTFASSVKLAYSHTSLSNMVHIKISVALILLAAAITPVLALPVPGNGPSKPKGSGGNA